MARVGIHVNRVHAAGKRPGLAEEIEAARREAAAAAGLALTAAAVFVGGPKTREITLRPAEGAALAEYAAATGTQVIAHSAYSAVPWRGDPDAARFIREEARACQAAGIAGLVVHLPKAPVATVAKYAARLVEPRAPGVRIFLETPAVTPRETYYETPAKLAGLFGALRAGLDPDLMVFGLCIDTAHLWTSGVDLASYDAAAAWLAELESTVDVIPPSAITVHLNDSARARGTGPDAHAALGEGKIWGDYRDRLGESGLAAVTDYAQRHGSTLILERKPHSALLGDYRILRELIPSAAVGGEAGGTGEDP